MKKLLVILVVALAAPVWGQQPGAAQPTQPAAGGQAAPAPQQQKTIKDPAEYNAYITALNQTEPAAKAQALEAFLQQYPNSVVKEDALDLLMRTYQQMGNTAKMQEKANQLLQVNPNSVPALALLTFTKRATIESGQLSPQNLSELQQLAQRGLQALPSFAKPEGQTEAQFENTKKQLSALFNGALGFGAMQQKDYKSAAGYLQEAVNVDANNLNNVYPLAVAYLEQQPPNPQGLWYIARAVNLSAGSPAQATIMKYGRAKYARYHGDVEGWDQLLAQSKTTPTPPAGWSVPPAPTPAEQAAKLVQSTPVTQMTFDQFQLVFTSGNQQAADTVWNQIKGKPIAFQAKVTQASKTKIMLAATAEDIEANKADVELTMKGPIPANLMPKLGEMIKVEGQPQSYDVSPFMIHMTEGAFIGAKPAPPKKTPPRRPARRRP